MICSLSGQVAQEPVVTKNGDIFEKRLILKHIETNGTCPITNEPLSPEDLISVRVTNPNAVKPRQLSSTSIPGLLQTFQNEWDALMLETFNLKKQLNTTRQQLSHSLYQNDAACRVIARLIKEKEAAKRELEQLRTAVSKGGALGKMEVENALPGLDTEARNKLAIKSQELSAMRKQKEVGPHVASIEEVKEFKLILSLTPHKASSPGVLSVDIHPVNQDLVITGGVDKTAIVLNRKTGRKEVTLIGHTKKVNAVKFHPTKDVLMTGSADNTVKIWTKFANEGFKVGHNITLHTQEIVGLSLHATNDYLVSASKDKTWAFHNIETGKSLLQVTEPDESPLTCVMLHPDGLILATGTEDQVIRVWDLKSQKNVATFRGHKAAITDLKFSENGYYLTTAAQDNLLKLWDLRGPKNISTLQMDSNVMSLDFDYSGKYLMAGTGHQIRLFTSKPPDHLLTLYEHTADVTCVKWGKDAQFLVSTSMDRTLKFWGRS